MKVCDRIPILPPGSGECPAERRPEAAPDKHPASQAILSGGVTSRLRAIAGRHRLRLVYLFGSQVEVGLALLRGEHPPVTDPMADIDVGVVFLEGLPPAQARAAVYAEMYNDLHDLFAPHSLDLCFLEEGHSVFQSSVLDGKCVYAARSGDREDYEEAVARKAADFRPVLERYMEEILEEV